MNLRPCVWQACLGVGFTHEEEVVNIFFDFENAFDPSSTETCFASLEDK